MVSRETDRTIVGIIGNVISILLFLSPSPTFINIFKQKSVEEFKADPYVATLQNCMVWIFYGLPFVHPDSLLVITINSIGLGIELLYLTIFIIYAPWTKRRRIFLYLVIEVIFTAIVVFVTLYFFHTTKTRTMFVGILCIIFNVAMYASPLTVMTLVIKTKSVKYMPFPLSLANLLNGIIWVIYAVLKFDLYILIPNALGTLSGMVQIILYATYYRTTRWNEEDEEEGRGRSEVQLSNDA
ncbi:hypothetical protein SLE2022_020610 [Rubroshorea leprosula]